VEWAEKLYNARARRRTGLVKSWSDVSLLYNELFLFQSTTVMPLLAAAYPDDSEIEAIGLALAGRQSAWMGNIVQRFPAEAAAEWVCHEPLPGLFRPDRSPPLFPFAETSRAASTGRIRG
jgi:hypothetical protein